MEDALNDYKYFINSIFPYIRDYVSDDFDINDFSYENYSNIKSEIRRCLKVAYRSFDVVQFNKYINCLEYFENKIDEAKFEADVDALASEINIDIDGDFDKLFECYLTDAVIKEFEVLNKFNALKNDREVVANNFKNIQGINKFLEMNGYNQGRKDFHARKIDYTRLVMMFALGVVFVQFMPQDSMESLRVIGLSCGSLTTAALAISNFKKPMTLKNNPFSKMRFNIEKAIANEQRLLNFSVYFLSLFTGTYMPFMVDEPNALLSPLLISDYSRGLKK